MHVCHRGWGVRTSLMRRLMREAEVKGGVILFRGSGSAARRYVEADRSRADEYYLGADDAVADYAVLDNTGEATLQRAFTDGLTLNAIADPESFTPEHITVVLDTYLARLAA